MNSRENFGYEYTVALCEAIEKLTEREEMLNGGVFKYKGANLRHALERSFYFNYATDDFLFDIFEQWKTNKLPGKIEVKDSLHRKLISIMCEIPEKNIIVRVSIANRIKKIFKATIRMLIVELGINVIVSALRKTRNDRIQNKVGVEVLFFVINERFVKFMRPIFDVLSSKCAYITHNLKTEEYLKKEKLPHVKISHLFYTINRWSQPDSWLKRFCLLEHYDILYDTIERLHSKSVVLVEGNAPPYEVVNQICKKLNIQSVCIQQGWSPIIHNGFRNMSYSKMLVWGNGFAHNLMGYNPKQKFIATGNFVIQKNSGSRIPKRAGDKIKLGFLPPMRTKILNQEKLDEFMSLVPWAANEFKNSEIRISQHPTIKRSEQLEKLSKYENVTFLSSQTHSLQDIIGGNDVAVSFYSTTILESIATGALPLMVNLTSMPHYFPDIHKLGAGIEVRSTKEAKKILREFINHPEKISAFDASMKKFREEYFAYDKETALKNIVNELVK